MGIGAFPQDHPLYAGIWGSHGYPETDQIVKMADMALCVGARMSNRGTSTEVLNQKEMIHIDIDPAEIGKNVNDTNIPVVGDAKTVLSEILEHDIQAADPEWMAVVHDIEAEHDKHRDEDLDPNLSGVNPRNFFRWLSDTAPEDTTLVADVGLNQVWAALHFQIRGDRKYLTSGGLGTMGYAIPAASGVCFGSRENPKTVVGVCGDGSFQMAMGELGVIAEHQLPLKLVVMNAASQPPCSSSSSRCTDGDSFSSTFMCGQRCMNSGRMCGKSDTARDAEMPIRSVARCPLRSSAISPRRRRSMPSSSRTPST